jgi:hypothetical protein
LENFEKHYNTFLQTKCSKLYKHIDTYRNLQNFTQLYNHFNMLKHLQNIYTHTLLYESLHKSTTLLQHCTTLYTNMQTNTEVSIIQQKIQPFFCKKSVQHSTQQTIYTTYTKLFFQQNFYKPTSINKNKTLSVYKHLQHFTPTEMYNALHKHIYKAYTQLYTTLHNSTTLHTIAHNSTNIYTHIHSFTNPTTIYNTLQNGQKSIYNKSYKRIHNFTQL